VSIREEVAREISALYGFIQSVSAACLQPPRSAAYTDFSERFFEYILRLSERSLEYLSSYPVEVEGTDEDFQDSRRELSIIRRAWRELHRFIKPAVDADTLNQPTALVEAMLSRLEQIPGFEGTEFAIFHTDEFNYFQVSPVLMARAVDGLAAIVGAQDLLKPALIGIPSSQGASLFLNCLVAHEIGHHAFGKKSVRPWLVAEIETALAQVIGDKYSKGNLPDRSTTIDLLAQWAEELFCDLFAVYLVGPCYSFAYVELYDVSSILDRHGAMANGEMRPFYPLYPSDLFRVRQQALLLKSLDWWKHVAPIESRCSRTLEALLRLSDQDFVDAEKEERKPIVEVFLRIVPEVSAQIGQNCRNTRFRNSPVWRTLEYCGGVSRPRSRSVQHQCKDWTFNIHSCTSFCCHAPQRSVQILSRAYGASNGLHSGSGSFRGEEESILD
jgi:hypothetical protein